MKSEWPMDEEVKKWSPDRAIEDFLAQEEKKNRSEMTDFSKKFLGEEAPTEFYYEALYEIIQKHYLRQN